MKTLVVLLLVFALSLSLFVSLAPARVTVDTRIDDIGAATDGRIDDIGAVVRAVVGGVVVPVAMLEL